MTAMTDQQAAFVQALCADPAKLAAYRESAFRYKIDHDLWQMDHLAWESALDRTSEEEERDGSDTAPGALGDYRRKMKAALAEAHALLDANNDLAAMKERLRASGALKGVMSPEEFAAHIKDSESS